MTRLMICICTALILFYPREEILKITYRYISTREIKENTEMNEKTKITKNTKMNDNTTMNDNTSLNHKTTINESTKNSISKMEALDLVKQQYAANFEKIYGEDTKEEYYYKLPFADYYLVYEGQVGEEGKFLIHLYEFVVDDPDSGIGHTVTYGWYTVDQHTGEITDQTQ